MPQLGETVTEGTITRWLKQVGDTVAEDEVLFEVSTDKVDSEVPSPESGVVQEILVPEGETVDVGTRLAVIGVGAPAAAAAPAPAAPSGAPEPPAPPAPAPPVEVAAAPAPAPALPEPAPAPTAEAPTGDVADGTQAPPPEAETPAAEPVRAERNGAGTRPSDDRPPSRPADVSGLVLSPVVRRLIAEHGIDPAVLTGTGTGGRITRSDVLDYIDRQPGNGSAPASVAPATPAPPAPAPVAPAPAAAAPSAPPAPPAPAPLPAPVAAPPAPAPSSTALVPLATAGDRDIVVPFTNIRRRTAEHMIRSKQISAHTMVAMEVDYVEVDKVRTAEKARFKEAEGFSLTYLPFIARAAIDALAEFPNVNSSVGDEQLIVHRDLNVGIAVDLDFEGLLVPVIHGADGKRLRQLARDISGLAARARSKKLTMDDIAGGTFTITNAGPFGTLMTVPVINQPQVAILSTDGVRKKPVAIEMPDGSDAIVVHPVGNLVMSWDHRAFDGAYAAAFVARIKAIIETRDWAAEL
jgi:2-oxoglutarate dehydrogenase E2 component (dihydrolipoamide succinyltransferase)